MKNENKLSQHKSSPKFKKSKMMISICKTSLSSSKAILLSGEVLLVAITSFSIVHFYKGEPGPPGEEGVQGKDGPKVHSVFMADVKQSN